TGHVRVADANAGLCARPYGMMMKQLSYALLILIACPAAASAQVIEIDSEGQAQTYDRPTVFNAAEAVPIESPKSARQTSSMPSGLLADAARAQGLDPGLLEAVAWQESRGRVNAVSLRGALGMMQLMPTTAIELGVDARDIVGNVHGGARYLRQQLDRFGSVPLALAAYNAGPGAVIRFRGIPPFRETRDYVTKIMGRWRPTAQTAVAKSTITEGPL
ncbi:MAG: lytic transglycosylase domain-containing protein, partial [Sphingomicrobium sp.]